MTKPSVIRVGQQFQAEVPAWHGPVPLDGSAPMMPEEIDLTGDVLALPEKEVAVYGVPAPRSKRVDARREKEEAERLRQASEERARRERARRATEQSRRMETEPERAERLGGFRVWPPEGVFVRTRGYDASSGLSASGASGAGLSASAGSVGTPLALPSTSGDKRKASDMTESEDADDPTKRPRTQDNEGGLLDGIRTVLAEGSLAMIRAAAAARAAAGPRFAVVAGAPEALLADGTLSEATFDVVCALEVLEHVADDGAFVAACARLARAGGDVFLSTLNRTPLAAAASITIAEGALGLLPRGTHDAAKFRTPGDVAALLGAAGCRVRDARALHFAPAPRGPGAAWLGGDARGAVNFVVHATREA